MRVSARGNPCGLYFDAYDLNNTYKLYYIASPGRLSSSQGVAHSTSAS